MSFFRPGRAPLPRRQASLARPSPNDAHPAASPTAEEARTAATRVFRPVPPAQATHERAQASQEDTSGVAQRGLRRQRSGETVLPPTQGEAAHTARRVAPRIGVSGRQQSEPAFSQPPTRRLRTTPSASDLGATAASHHAPQPGLVTPPTPSRALHPPQPLGSAPSSRAMPKASTVRSTRAASVVTRAAFPSGSVGRAAQPGSPGALRTGARQPLPSPGAARGEARPRVSHIPHPAPPTGIANLSEQPGSALFAKNQSLVRELEVEKRTNKHLNDDACRYSEHVESLKAELALAQDLIHDVRQRAERAELELSECRAENAALAEKVAALTVVAKSRAGLSGSLPSPRVSRGAAAELASQHSNDSDEAAGLDGNWRDRYSRMTAAIGAVRDSYQAGASESADRDLRIVDEYLRDSADSERSAMDEPPSVPASGARGDSARLFTPRQRRLAAQDERVHRRRSSMLFAGLIQPSGCAAAGGDDDAHAAECARCAQLYESLQAVLIDNDYYREANEKLRGSVADVVSRHNAMVRAFERERNRRREVRARELAEASHLAARDRALLEAHQRADLGMDADEALAQHFAQTMHIG